MRVLLNVSYLGTNYVGWQFQENGISVQETLEKALFEATGLSIRVTGASRTDSGVHALGQRAHFDTPASIPAERYPFVLNRYLPEDVRVMLGQQVPGDFHARFAAREKTYTYRIYNAPHPSAITHAVSWHVPLPLDTEKMDRAVRTILGTYDFAAFAAAGGQAKTTVRRMLDASVSRSGPMIEIRITGTGFLYNMVRIISGTLAAIGLGKLDGDCFSRALQSLSRLDLGVTAPPQGLELTRVSYAPALEIKDP
ncbi:MAG: tRNA pseudouridine(38-40) synthase TruA [Clostridia bacterium]|nr:tRNA pseudouridine(38-40) synthase TruA [Clostridia bacterium]